MLLDRHSRVKSVKIGFEPEIFKTESEPGPSTSFYGSSSVCIIFYEEKKATNLLNISIMTYFCEFNFYTHKCEHNHNQSKLLLLFSCKYNYVPTVSVFVWSYVAAKFKQWKQAAKRRESYCDRAHSTRISFRGIYICACISMNSKAPLIRIT